MLQDVVGDMNALAWIQPNHQPQADADQNHGQRRRHGAEPAKPRRPQEGEQCQTQRAHGAGPPVQAPQRRRNLQQNLEELVRRELLSEE